MSLSEISQNTESRSSLYFDIDNYQLNRNQQQGNFVVSIQRRNLRRIKSQTGSWTNRQLKRLQKYSKSNDIIYGEPIFCLCRCYVCPRKLKYVVQGIKILNIVLMSMTCAFSWRMRLNLYFHLRMPTASFPLNDTMLVARFPLEALAQSK